jgi:hypothetical protein
MSSFCGANTQRERERDGRTDGGEGIDLALCVGVLAGEGERKDLDAQCLALLAVPDHLARQLWTASVPGHSNNNDHEHKHTHKDVGTPNSET